VIPEGAQRSLAAARGILADATRSWVWSLLFLVWTRWTLWAAAVSVPLMLVSYSAILEAAQTFAILVEAAYDVHRGALYKALRWPLPGSADVEAHSGEQITAYLWHGSRDVTTRFTGAE
jgi:hypothetical protein